MGEDDFLSTKRHSQTLVDAADRTSFHWDGEFDTIEELVTRRLGVPSGLQVGYGAPPTSQQPQPTVTLVDDQGRDHTVDLRRVEGLVDDARHKLPIGDAQGLIFDARDDDNSRRLRFRLAVRFVFAWPSAQALASFLTKRSLRFV